MKTVYQLTMLTEGAKPFIAIFETQEAIDHVIDVMKTRSPKSVCTIQEMESFNREEAIELVNNASHVANLYNTINANKN